MSGEPRIEQFRLADREALFDFLRLAYPDEPRKYDPAYWKWHYLDHPLIREDDIPVWVVKSGERIVGQVATIPVEVKADDQILPAIWILDFIVLEEIRGKGFGKKLMAAAGAAYPTMVALGFNEMSEAVLLRTGWAAVGGASRYHKILFPGNALKELRSVAPVRAIANLAYAPLRSRAAADPGVRKIDEFGPDFDDLWQRASTQWPCAVIRSRAYLNWQFREQPGKTFDVFGLYRDGRLDGYVVTFLRRETNLDFPPKAAISDICYAAENTRDTVSRLLASALDHATERRAGGLVTDIHDPLVERSLEQLGFWKVKTGPRFMVYTPELTELMYDEKNWYLTRGDSDVSIFEEANTW